MHSNPKLRASLAAASRAVSRSCRRSLLSAAIASAMLAIGASGTIAAPAQPPQSAVPVALGEQSVAIDAQGAVYLSRASGALHFWIVDEAAGTIQRKASLMLDASVTGIVAIELGAGTTGLFYADNIVQPGDAFRLSFRGEVSDGRIALPIAEPAFAPLWSVATPDEVVVVAPGDAALQAVLDTQTAIYQRVADVGQLHADQVDLFRIDMETELAKLYEMATGEGAAGEQLIASAAAGAQDLHDRFVAQAATDEAEILGVAAAVEQFAAEQTRRVEGEMLSCIAQATQRIEKQMSTLQQKMEALPDDEEVNEAIETAIADAERGIARHEAIVAACADVKALETYDPRVGVDAEGAGYAPIGTAADALELVSEAGVEQWALAVEARAAEQGGRVEENPRAADMMEYQGYFAKWLSPVYADESDSAGKSGDAGEALEEGAPDLERVVRYGAKGQEALCDAETWNVEFTIGGFSIVFATPWNDRVVTGNDHNLIFTFRGDDCIESHAGYDAVFAGRGRDTIFGGDDHDFLFGGRDNDRIHGSAGNTYTVTIGPVVLAFDIGNLIIGQAGADAIFGGEVSADRGEDGNVDNNGYTDLILGDSFLFGGPAGGDTVFGEMGVDFIFGQDGNDTLSNLVPGVITVSGVPVPFGSFFFGNAGNDTIIGSNTTIAGVFPLMGDFIFGNAGNDIVNANAGMDFVFGNDGDDQLDAGRDMDFAFGNDGNDTVTGNDGADLVAGALGDDTVFGSPGLIDLVLGGQGNDRLFGNDGFDLVFGNVGTDTIQGGNGIDLIFGGPAGDVINGNDGVDLIFGGAGEDRIGGDDGIDLIFGNRDSDIVNGGADFDVIFGNDNSEKQEILSGDGGVDLIFGNEGNDRIFGNDGVDLLFGNRGRDEINGNNGVDVVFGNDDIDVIRGDDGLDLLFGNDGNDDIAGGNGVDVAFGNAGCDVVSGNADPDLLFGNDGKDRLWGGDGIDLMFGNAGQDALRGENGSDLLFGNDDNDSLGGDDALDMLVGGSGEDFMLGGTGNDVMMGGDGNDFARGDANGDFVFGGNHNDVVDGAGETDFLFGQDGDDAINSGTGTDFSFGNSGADRLRAVEGSNFAFGNGGNDTVDGYSPSTPDPRDFLFGNSNNDTLTGNQNNQKDLRAGGGGSDSKHWNTTYVSAALFNGSWNGNSNCN